MPPKYPIAQPNAETRPIVAGVDTCRSTALYDTYASSMKIDPSPSSTSPRAR